MATAFAILALLLAAPAVYATDYTVGGNSGWDAGVDYTTWVSNKKFLTGDTLSFTYGSNHGVDVVSQADYNNCNTGNALTSYSGGNNKITLSKAGNYYYICPTLGHCAGGMKLAVTVSDASTPSTTPTTTPSSPTSPTTPTTSSPGSTSTAPTSPTSPTQSSSPSGAMGSFKNLSVFTVVASLVLAPLLSGLMG